MKVWPNTDLFCGGSHGIPLDERLRVKRPYGRVDRAVRGRPHHVYLCCVHTLQYMDADRKYRYTHNLHPRNESARP